MKKIYLFAIVVLLAGWLKAQKIDPAIWEVNGEVSTIASDNQYIYLGGKFNYAGPTTGSWAKLSTNKPFPNLNYPIVNGKVIVSVPDGKNGWFIAGKFTQVGNQPRENIAHILADGTVSSWKADANGPIATIALDDSMVYIGGYFTQVNNLKRNYLARINRFTGKVDTTWNPNPSSFVCTIALSDTFVYVGGYYSKICNVFHRYISRIDKKNCTLDQKWSPIPDNIVETITLDGNVVYIGGKFTSLWGVGPAYYAAKLNNTDGKPVIPFWYPNPDSYVKKIIPVGDEVYLVGDFFHVGRQVVDTMIERHFVARVGNKKGKADISWDPQPDGYVNDLYVGKNGIYIAGDFENLGNTPKAYFAKLSITGNVDKSWYPVVNGPVYCIASHQNDIYIGGTFSSVGGVTRYNLLRLNKHNYTIDKNWIPKPKSGVTSVIPDGKNIYIGGYFNVVGRHLLPYVARVNNTNGAPDTNWMPIPNKPVYSMALNHGDLFIAGEFTHVGSGVGNHNFSGLAKIDTSTGYVHMSWNPDPGKGLPGSITHIAIKGPYIYAAGRFMNDDRSRVIQYFKRISTETGKEDPTWNPRPNQLVLNFIFHRHALFVSGEFSRIGGISRKKIAKINDTNGLAYQEWNPDVAGGMINSLAADNKYLYIGGNFTSVGDTPLHTLARLDICSGSADTGWDPNFSSTRVFGPEIHSLAFNHNDLLAGGSGTNFVGPVMKNNFFVFHETPEKQEFKITAIAKGSFSYHSLAIGSNGHVYAWGYNNKGQLGTGISDTMSNTPTAVDTTGVLKGKEIVEASVTYRRSMVLTSDGKIYMWGENTEGELGNNSTQNSPVPVAVDTTGVLKGKKIIHIAAGCVFSMALDNHGKVYTWGYAYDGELGTGKKDYPQSLIPVAVDTTGVLKGKKIIAIAAGTNHAVALDSNGHVFTWGLNDVGQSGNHSDAKYSLAPVMVDTTGVLAGKKIVAVAAGTEHVLALTSDGKVYAWGSDTCGQLGNGTNTDSNIPVAVKTDGVLSGKKVIAIAAGGDYSLALTSDGKIFSWGENNIGQLGHPGHRDSNVPISVVFSDEMAGKRVIDIAAGIFHSMALTCDGKVYSWGANYYGQLGNSHFTGTFSETPVEADWQSIMAVIPMAAGKNSTNLLQNYPNPVKRITTFRFTIPQNGTISRTGTKVTLNIYDIAGRKIATLINGYKQPGNYSVSFDTSPLGKGIYIYKLQFGNQTVTKKMVVTK